MKGYSPSHVNGKEAVEAVYVALETDEPCDLICSDIMMPEMEGQTVLGTQPIDKAKLHGYALLPCCGRKTGTCP